MFWGCRWCRRYRFYSLRWRDKALRRRWWNETLGWWRRHKTFWWRRWYKSRGRRRNLSFVLRGLNRRFNFLRNFILFIRTIINLLWFLFLMFLLLCLFLLNLRLLYFYRINRFHLSKLSLPSLLISFNDFLPFWILIKHMIPFNHHLHNLFNQRFILQILLFKPSIFHCFLC